MAVKIFNFQFPGIASVRCAFQYGANADISFKTCASPEQAIAARKELFALCAAHGLKKWSECNQVHGSNIVMEPAPTELDCLWLQLPEADGMTCSEAGHGLLIKTADCQPVFVAHKSGKYIMALHVGWRGNRADFPALAIAKFCERYNLAPGDLLAVRGPSLGPACAEFVNFDREWGENFREWFEPEQKTMNLWALTRSQLLAAGLANNAIYGLDICTCANSDSFYSYRRDKKSGRQANLIWIDTGC